MKYCKIGGFILLCTLVMGAPVEAMHHSNVEETEPTFKITTKANGMEIRLPEEYDLDLENRALQELARKLLESQKQSLRLYVKGQKERPLVCIEASSKGSWGIDTVQSLSGFGVCAHNLIEAARTFHSKRGPAREAYAPTLHAARAALLMYVGLPEECATSPQGSGSSSAGSVDA